MKGLLIAEKPSLMRTIKSVYSKGLNLGYLIDFTCFAGHIISRVTPDEYCDEWAKKPWSYDALPMLPNNYKFKVSSDKTKMFKDLKTMVNSGDYDFLINACDPDREGQAIFQYFYDFIGCKLPVKRFWTNDLTEGSIEDALKNLRTDSDGKSPNLVNLTQAATLRGEYDWDIGMNFTRAGSISFRKTTNLGRVKTAALKIAATRELELKNFVPKTTYELDSVYDMGFNGTLFDDNGNIRFETKKDADDILKELGKTAVVESVKKTVAKTEAPQLYKLSTLQKDAGQAFGISVDKTLEVVQSLYEKKIVSYPRTDNPYVSSSVAQEFPKLLKSVSYIPALGQYVSKITDTDIKKVASNSKYVNDKKLAESGHYAIIPTVHNGIAFNKLSQDEQNVLFLIYTRFLAIFLPPKEDYKTTIITKNGKYQFKSVGTQVKTLGFMELYNYKPKETILPPLNKGDSLNVKEFVLVDKVSTPPPRYTDATFIQTMDNPVKFLEDNNLKTVLSKIKGIGTEATRAGIIKELEKNGFIEIKKKGKSNYIFATDLGLDLIEKLGDFHLTKVDMTAEWESKLEDVSLGKLSVSDFKKEEKKFIEDGIEYLKKMQVSAYAGKGNGTTSGKSKIEYLKEKCPKCGQPIKMSAKYYMCDKYKDGCDFILGKVHFGAKINKTDVKKLIKGENIEKEWTWKSGKKSKCEAKLENGKIKFLFN